MKLRGRRLNVTVLLGGVLFALLPLLAFLQYRWLGRISEAEHQKMLESLQRDTDQFCKDFDFEVTRAFMTFTISDDSTDEEKASEYSAHYSRWLGASKYPGLVNSIWDVEFRNRQWNVSRFDPVSRSLDQSQWPAGMKRVRDRIEATATSGWFSPRVVGPDSSEADALPALIVPRTLPVNKNGVHSFTYRARILTTDPGPAREDIFSELLPGLKGAVMGSQPGGFTIVAFDYRYLTEQFIPQLGERRFGGKSGSEYALTIVQPDPERVVYQSDPTRTGLDPAKGDVVEKVFGVRLDELPDLFTGDGSSSGTSANAMILKTTRGLPLSPSGTESTPKAAEADMQARFTPEGIWEVAVRHKAGSLEAAVAATRHKNLAISFGVLMLLGASIAFLLTSTHRAKKLARQQVEFVAGISHEFRTPLAVICSAGENLGDGVIDSSAQVKAYGKLIGSEGKRLTAMMEQMLQFAGVQSGRQPATPKPVDAADIIDRALAGCHLLITEGQFTVDKRIDPALPPVLAVPDGLEGSIQNLLSNAIKYAGSERWIGVFVRRSAGPPTEVEITIQDRGIGIPGTEIANIFKPFYRGKRALAAQIHGSGLGLSLVKHYVEAAGGRVTVSSSTERGSAFTLHLPVAPEAAVLDLRSVKSACESPEFGS